MDVVEGRGLPLRLAFRCWLGEGLGVEHPGDGRWDGVSACL